MALVVCCPCGYPLDCDNLDIVVTLPCPRCGLEIPLELETALPGVARGVLTVMEGPHWVGEQFIVPVDMDLTIGTASGNWLSLESADLAESHCRLHMDTTGRLMVEDLQSPTGTWITEQRILRGRLQPKQSLRVGEFRFRFDFQSAEGSTIAPAAVLSTEDVSKPLPAIDRVSRLETPGLWVIHHRFHVCRVLMLSAAWLLGLYNACRLMQRPDQPWPCLEACVAGVAIGAVLAMAGRRVTLIHRYFKFASLGVLVLLAMVDAYWSLPTATVSCFILAVCLALLIIRTPSQPMALGAALLGLIAVTTTVVVTIQELQQVIVTRW